MCDAFDAMTSNRPYATARPAEAAIVELRRVSGEQFDPAVVEGFVSAWHERDRRRHGDDALDAAA